MLSRRSLFGILLLHMVLSVAYTDSARPEGKNNPCPDPDNANMLQRPITTIKGKVGDTVILPCSREDKMDLSYDRVKWFKDSTKENEPIHKYVWRGHAIQTQRDDLKDRTSLSEEELSSGNCSLSLKVTTSHSGSYYCCVPGLLYCPVNLEVLPAEEDTSQKHQDDPESPVNPPIHPEENTHLYDPLNPDMLQCPDTTIEVKDGDTVILPCSKKNKMDISLEEVEWSTKDPTTGKKTVHLYFQGEDFLHQQSDDFKDRTSLFKEELSSGNCSLSLLVTTSHSGRYYCCVGGRLCCTETLKVLPKGEDSSQMHQDDPESPDNPLNDTDGQNNIIGGVVGGVLGVVALIIMITLAYRHREQLKNYCSGMKPKNQQIYQGVPLQAQQQPEDEEKKTVDQNIKKNRSC